MSFSNHIFASAYACILSRCFGVRPIRTVLGSCVILLPLTASTSAIAQSQTFQPVHLRIAGREVLCRTSPLADDREVYVPLEALTALNITAQTNRRGDAAMLTWEQAHRRQEIALARPNGQPMIALSDLARFVNGYVERPDIIGRWGRFASGKPGALVYLLARITDVHFEDGALKIATSFPVPYLTRTINSGWPHRGYVDCLGAMVAPDFRPNPIPMDVKIAQRLRAARNDVQTARVVVEMPDGVTLKASESPSNSNPLIVAGVSGTPRPGRVASNAVRNTSPSARSTDSSERVPFDQGEPPPEATTPGHDQGDSEGGTAPDTHTDVTGNGSAPATGAAGGTTVSGASATPKKGATDHSVSASASIRALTFLSENSTRARLNIATSRKTHPFVHYRTESNQLVLDIPNTRLSLIEPASSEQALSHPLVSGLHAQLIKDTPPTTRITLDMPRIAGFSVNTDSDKISLELRLPRNASGVLADKVIVVDAGHGGSSTGAVGRGGGHEVYEKNCTLAIAMKLRAALEEAGAKVIMTRDRDVNVPLDDRPNLANNTHADLFISVHNDSNGVPNSASGTSTYYHMSDASSRALAACVQREVLAVSGLPSRGVLSDGIMYASGFAVLRLSKMPAVLCEVAYINNANDRRHLTDEDFQRRVAKAMCDGLRDYVEGNPHLARTARRTVPKDPESAIPTTQDSTPIAGEDMEH